MSTLTVSSRWAVGEPMIAWCARNGLDATRIPDRADAVTPEHRGRDLWARVWHVLCEDDLPWTPGPDVVASRTFDEQVEYARVVPVDSMPPVSPEWEAAFPEAARQLRDEWTGGRAPSRPHEVRYDVDRDPDSGAVLSWSVRLCSCDAPWRHG